MVSSHIIEEEHGVQCMPCSSSIICEMLPEIQTMEKYDFLKSVIHSDNVILCCRSNKSGLALLHFKIP